MPGAHLQASVFFRHALSALASPAAVAVLQGGPGSFAMAALALGGPSAARAGAGRPQTAAQAPTSVPLTSTSSPLRAFCGSSSRLFSAASAGTSGRGPDARAGVAVTAAGVSLGDGTGNGAGKKPRARRKAKPVAWYAGIKGVGEATAEKLGDAGITSTEGLEAVFTGECGGDTQAFKAYVKENSSGTLRISAHFLNYLEEIANRAEQRQQEQDPVGAGSNVSLCIEGNISAGKSTFLNIMKEDFLQFQELVEVVPEPVDAWQNLPGAGGAGSTYNILDLFYDNPKRYAYTFQNYVFVTRMMQGQSAMSKPLRLLERSVFSDRMVFVRAVHKSGWMSDVEMSIYDSWFNPMLQTVPSLVPDGFVYLRAEPETCMRRMHRRGRNEEGGVQLSYLEELHENHEAWLNRSLSVTSERERRELGHRQLVSPLPQPRTLTLRGNYGLTDAIVQQGEDVAASVKLTNPRQDLVPPVPPELEGQVKMLSTEHVDQLPDALSQVPALILDCNTDYDVHGDQDTKQDYASKVTTYHKWVQEYRRRLPIAGMPSLHAALRTGQVDDETVQMAIEQAEYLKSIGDVDKRRTVANAMQTLIHSHASVQGVGDGRTLARS